MADREKKTKQKVDTEKIIQDLRYCNDKTHTWRVAAEEDVEFAVGHQWKDEDKRDLEAIGAPALTINKIQPNLFLLSGIQRQNRTDLKAFPEGNEDSLEGEIVSRLLKNIMKRSQSHIKLSEQFDDGAMCGEGWIEPYIDYTYDMLNGHMKIRKDSPFDIYVDPASKEYDLSDARYVIKVTEDLTREQLLELFPEKEKLIDEIGEGKITFENNSTEPHHTPIRDKYKATDKNKSSYNEDEVALFDLVEYYYKKYVRKYVVLSKRLGQIREFEQENEAKQIAAAMQELEKKEAETQGIIWDVSMTSVKVISKVTPEIWMASCIGENEVIEDKVAWSYPNWKSYPLFRFKARYITIPIRKSEYMTQGIVRSLKDPQRELNKRRSQELRILNSQSNSGYIGEEGAFIKKKETWQKFGSTPGIILEYKKGSPKPEKQMPAQFPSAHAMSAEENKNDIKEISGINADLLAMSDNEANSGRAMMVRMKQGTVMVQAVFDNFSQTKILFGKFLLSQLGEIYTVETAIRVLGDSFIKTNFSIPQKDPRTGQPILDQSGELAMQVDPQMVSKVINNILVNSKDVDAYDLEIGEVVMTETIKYANTLLLQEMARNGMAIPPEVLLEDSTLSEESKAKIKKSNEQQMKMQLAMQQQGKNLKGGENNG